jgi:hypothetical protein
MSDKQDNPLNKYLENPAFYLGGAALALFGSYMNWFDPIFLLIVLPAAGFGLFRWFQNKNA